MEVDRIIGVVISFLISLNLSAEFMIDNTQDKFISGEVGND